MSLERAEVLKYLKANPDLLETDEVKQILHTQTLLTGPVGSSPAGIELTAPTQDETMHDPPRSPRRKLSVASLRASQATDTFRQHYARDSSDLTDREDIGVGGTGDLATYMARRLSLGGSSSSLNAINKAHAHSATRVSSDLPRPDSGSPEMYEVMMETITDLFAMFDEDAIAHEFVQTIQRLIHCKTCSLFLYDSENGHLVPAASTEYTWPSGPYTSPLYDKIGKAGEGFPGHCIQSGVPLICNEAKDHPNLAHYDNSHPSVAKLRSVLCIPVEFADSMIGVLQLTDESGLEYAVSDSNIVSRMATLLAIALQHWKRHEKMTYEQARANVMLEITRSIVSYPDLESVLYIVIKHARELIGAERSSCYILDKARGEFLCTKLNEEDDTCHLGDPIHCEEGITGHVTKTGTSLIVTSAANDVRFKDTLVKECGENVENVLCSPLKGSDGQVFGATQLINSTNVGGFSRDDVDLMEAFAVSASIAIENAQLTSKLADSEKRNRIFSEMLSYRGQPSLSQVDKILHRTPRSFEPENFTSFNFDIGRLTEEDKVVAVLKMFHNLDLLKSLRINEHTLGSMVMTMARNYRDLPYHNWEHAVNVCHYMYCFLSQPKMQKVTNKVTQCAMLVAALGHDLDHWGVNNGFMAAINSDLAYLYGQSVMERHHFACTINILSYPSCNILANIEGPDFIDAVITIENVIISTDLAMYFKNMGAILEAFNKPDLDLVATVHERTENARLMESILITACDLCGTAKPWDQHLKQVMDLVTEFYVQGDMERELGKEPLPMMDRRRDEEIPDIQIGFLSKVARNAFVVTSNMLPAAKSNVENLDANIDTWKKLKNDRARLQKLIDGRTFDDHDAKSRLRPLWQTKKKREHLLRRWSFSLKNRAYEQELADSELESQNSSDSVMDNGDDVVEPKI
eukprot:Clim_evm59s207 gene=Clim_evmTU59s207